MILLGYFLRKEKIIDEVFEHDLGKLLVDVIQPICIIGSGNTVFSKELSHNLSCAAVIAVIYYIISIFFMFLFSRILKAEKTAKNIFVMLCVFANTGYLGMPILSEFFGAEGMLYAVIYSLVYNLFFFSIGIVIISGKTDHVLKKIFTTPATISSILAIILFVSPFRLPVPIADTVNQVGSMMVPLSIIIIGCKLADIKLLDVLTDRLSYCVSFFRLIFFPICLLFILKPFHLDNSLASSLVLLTGMPSGTLNAIVADQYHCEEDFAARAVSQSTFLMIATLPLIFLLLGE